MKKRFAVGLVVLLGACDAAPERITAPDDARRGGFTIGTGNRSDAHELPADSTVTMDVMTSETCLDERGGFTYGSGNLVDVPACPRS